MTKISNILTGENESMYGLPDELTSSDLKFYKYAPMTFTYIKSFSWFKNILSNNCRSFDIKNLKKNISSLM